MNITTEQLSSSQSTMILFIIYISCSVVFSQNSIITNELLDIHRGNEFSSLLQEITVKTLEPAKCVVIFSDEIYSDLYDINWFSRFGFALSFIMIYVEESEDLYAPNERIQESLLLAKGEGCQMYIILITNGLQAARLLKFGDRYRALNTLSKYILLYDHRLFEENLSYLWKKIINVIFIKKYASRKLFSDNKLDWFEISTVPFPVPITTIMIPRRLDIWTSSKFRKNVELFRDKTSDLQNQTLKVVLFAHTPGITKVNTTYETVRAILSKYNNNNTKFSGTEAEILQSVAKAMNFRYEVHEPENAETEMWGRKTVGGVYTGLMGEIVSTRADIALADLYYTSYILNVMDLSVPYNAECLTFITPESLTDNSWKTLILPFSPILWTTVLISLCLCIASFHYLAMFHMKITEIRKQLTDENRSRIYPVEIIKKKRVLTLSLWPEVEKLNSNAKYVMMKEKYQSVRNEDDPVGLYQFSEPVNSALYTYSMILLVSLPKLPTGWSLRVLTGWYWIYCLLVVTSYRASMTAILARPIAKLKIDTLEELVDSPLTLSGWGEINSEFFKSSSDLTMRQIAKNFVLVNDSDKAVDRVAEESFAFYENIYFLKEASVKRQHRFKSAENQSEKSGREDRMLHIMNECIINMPVSIGLQRNSPIKPRVDKYVRRVLEAGLIHKWLDDVMQNVLNAEVQTEDAGNTKALMNMRKFSGALVALFIGYFISLIALLTEIVYFRKVVASNDHFNKYSRRIEAAKPI